MRDRKKGFTSTPICVVVEQVKAKDKQFCRQIPNSFARGKLVWGFTLVEIMTVLAIIAMLTGILLPALNAARKAARKTACKENLHGCGIAFRMYLDENQNVMPFAVYLPTQPSDSEITNKLKPISVVLAKFLSGPEALKCPADPQAQYYREQGSSYQYNTGLGGIRIDGKDVTFTRRGGTRTITIPLAEIDVMSDYEGFHGNKNADGSYPVGAYMYLYADNLISDRTRGSGGN